MYSWTAARSFSASRTLLTRANSSIGSAFGDTPFINAETKEYRGDLSKIFVALGAGGDALDASYGFPNHLPDILEFADFAPSLVVWGDSGDDVIIGSAGDNSLFGDYGSGAVERMGGSDVLVCLLEHPPEDANAPLFERVGVPMLSNAQFSPQTMQRAVPGAAGSQHFFQVGGRPFCLYVVIGSFRTRGPLVRAANEVVRSIRVAAR